MLLYFTNTPWDRKQRQSSGQDLQIFQNIYVPTIFYREQEEEANNSSILAIFSMTSKMENSH